MALVSSGLPLAIVGAGPAGLTAAIASAQRGLTPTVVERVDTMTPAGGGIVVHSNGLRVRFDSGEPMECTVAIGADGVHSRVREALPVRAISKAAGDAYLRGISESETDRAEVREIWGVDGRRFGIAPLTQERTYFYCSAPRGVWHDVRRERLEAWIDSWGLYGRRVYDVLHHVLDWEHVNYDEPEQVRVTRWYSGRTFLIGDAAHAMTPNYGQGANAAMVDAVVLSALLARGSIADVGRQYESIRRRFVDRTQTAAWQIGVVAQWTSPMMRLVRDSAFRALSRVHFLSRRDLLLAAGYNAQEYSFLQSP